MIENMIHYQDDARSMQEDLVEAFGAGNWKMDKEEFMKTLELLSSVGDLRMKAQKCAVDAAPFIHAKLSAIAMQVEHKKAADVEDGSIERARDDFRQLRSQSYVPPVIDGEVVPVQADEAEDEEA